MNNILFLGLSLIAPTICVASPKERPNIILIMADDLGWGDVGFNGNKVVNTPHLDALASSGVVMERFYSGSPLSSPTRASVLTGRNPFRTGVFSANVGILRREETTIPELLKEQGYATGIFGKWHLGTLTTKEVDANRGGSRNKHLYNPPSWHGFDVSFVTESKVPTFDPMIKPFPNDERFWDYIHEGDSLVPYGTAYWDQKGVKVTENVSGDDSRLIVDRVLPFIDKSIKKDTPFLSVIWFHAPHLPCVAGPEQAALYDNLSLDKKNYYGCITALDEQVGRLIAYLKAKNVYKNSIIFFCSDNGPELKTPGSSGGFRDKKRSLYEGGIRVPAIMCWTSKIPGGSRLSQPCSTSDYLPTLLDITGVSSGTNLKLDGESLWPLITKQTTRRRQSLVFCSEYQGAVIDGDYKLYYTKGQYELYNIAKDDGEKENIVSRCPEKKKKLEIVLKQSIEDYKQSFEIKEKKERQERQDWQTWWSIWDSKSHETSF